MPARPAPSPITTTPAAFPERRRFTVQEYEQMIKAGVFGEDDRLELIEGELIPLSPIGPDHAGHVNRLNRLFTRRVGGHALVSIQNPLQPEVRIVNLLDKWVEVYRGPGARGYKEKRTVSLKESLTPLALPNVTLKVREILSA